MLLVDLVQENLSYSSWSHRYSFILLWVSQLCLGIEAKMPGARFME
uniref:Uncharacterized protein n=1 Tax=Arundo donax TaxID=35708 RepID=A0A0A8Z3X1_ARUDO